MSGDRCFVRGAAAVALSMGVVVTSQIEGAEPEQRSALACELRGDLSVPSGHRIVVHHPGPEQERRLAAATPQSFGPFDRGVHGFERVLFYVDVPEPGGSWRVQEADLLIRLDGPRSPWFRMVSSWRRPELPQLSVSRGPEGQNVRAATPDPAVPLFVVEMTMDNGRSDVTSQYLVDLRPGRPRVPALLECVEILTWGPCGAWDAGYSWPSGPVACAWERHRGDFQCRETRAVSTPWGSRTSVREFALLSAPEREETRATRLASELGAFAASAAGDPSARRDVETIGPVHPVATVPRAGGGTLVLLGAAGTSSAFGARFFLGVRAPDGSVRVSSVIESRLPDFSDDGDGFRAEPVDVPGTPEPGELSFRAIPLVSTLGGRSTLRVRVREAAPHNWEGPASAEAVYWIGIEDRGAEVIAGALRLATSTAEYAGCGSARTPPNAVGAKLVSTAPFAAELEVEPPHVADFLSQGFLVIDEPDPPEDASRACPARVRVTWSSGFEVGEPDQPSACPGAQLRLAQIDDDGEIRAVPAPMAQPEP